MLGVKGAWKEAQAPNGKTYYYNTLTKETAWRRPPEMGGAPGGGGAATPSIHAPPAAFKPAARQLPSAMKDAPSGGGSIAPEQEEELQAMGVKELKAFLTARDVECKAALDKEDLLEQARTAVLAGKQPVVWREATAPDGRKYYFNPQTKKTSWTKPAHM